MKVAVKCCDVGTGNQPFLSAYLGQHQSAWRGYKCGPSTERYENKMLQKKLIEFTHSRHLPFPDIL